MLVRKGKELNNIHSFKEIYEEEKIKIVKEEKIVELFYYPGNKDEIKMIFKSPKRETYAQKASLFWKGLIKGEYEVLPSGQVWLPPKIYWNIYKRVADGKNILLGVGNQLYINGNKCSFLSPQDYFTNISTGEKIVKGVYGIYYKEELLYIGSSVSKDVNERWLEHQENFKQRSIINQMYSYIPLDEIGEIEYRLIISEDELKEKVGEENYSNWGIQFAEASLIIAEKPKFNVIGKEDRFIFNAKKELDTEIKFAPMLKNMMRYFCEEGDIGFKAKFEEEIGIKE